MGGKRDERNWKVSRPEEEEHLEKTLVVVKDNLVNYGQEVARMQADIDEMLAHYHDNDAEVYTILSNTVTMHDHMKWALERNERALSKPYFGRIIFHDETLDKEESIYIGKGGISKDATHQIVVDWRAPVANAYYESNLGKCSYAAPGDVEMEIDLELKRTYEIEGGELIDYFDSEVIANDDLLTKYLAKNKQTVLNEIVATIQKEQNEIIRKSPYHNIIVQGVAGSGKTTVAMHRISYILYNYAERFKPDDFYIVGSNRILLDYITGVLPDLDVHGVRQMTMEQLFVRLLYEDWDEKKYRIKSAAGSVKESDDGKAGSVGKNSNIKGKSQWFQDLEEYCRKIEQCAISVESIYLNPKQFVEGFRDGKTGVFDETIGKKVDPKSLVCLMDGAAVKEYLQQNPSISVQNKIDMLNQRLIGKIKDEFLGKGIKYTEVERKAILKAYRGWYGGKEWKESIFKMYQDFLMKQAIKGYEVEIPDKEFDVYDLAALAYLYKRIKEKEVISEAHHVVIDEAQDFGMMAYHVLKFCINGCTYTVMGDVSQNIHFGYGLNDWEELKNLLLPNERDSFGLLKKSYRNTVEISNFATDILHHGTFFTYPVEPIIRHGNPVQIRKLFGKRQLIQEAAKVCKDWQQKGLDTIAVICRDQESASAISKELSEYVEVMESNLEKAVFGNGIMVLPVEYTKGLEFDAVLILDPTRKDYPVEDGHAKLLYVAATRALHELCVLHAGNLTGLIADPVPQKVVHQMPQKSTQEISQSREINKAGQRKAGEFSENQRQKAKQDLGEKWGEGKEGSDREIGLIGLKNESSRERENKTAAFRETGTINRKKPIAVARPKAAVSIATPEDKKPFFIRQKELYSPENASPIVSLAKTQDKMEDPVKPIRKKSANNGNGYKFGDLPATEILRPAGHGKIDLTVRWVEKGMDGLYLKSRYGTLRLCPVSDSVIRVTFAKGASITGRSYPSMTGQERNPKWIYKSSGSTVDLLMDELFVQVDKTSGAIRYMTRDKKLLLTEKSNGSRQLENGIDGKMKTWLYLDWAKGENIYAVNPAAGNDVKVDEKNLLKMRGTVKYISGEEKKSFPFLLSDKSYGLVFAAESPVICCDIPAYGTYLYAENEVQMDYYFIIGRNRKEIFDNYTTLLK